MADTLTLNQSFVVGGVTYNIMDIVGPIHSPNTQVDRNGLVSFLVHVKIPGAGAQPTDYRNINLHNQGGKAGSV